MRHREAFSESEVVYLLPVMRGRFVDFGGFGGVFDGSTGGVGMEEGDLM